jgi:hypothetical protein
LVQDDWLKYMKDVHIRDVMRTGCFTKCEVSRVMEPVDKDEFAKYRIEYFCSSIQDYERYRKEFAAVLQHEHAQRYAGKFTAAREVRELV